MTIRHTHSTELTLSQNQMGSGQHSLTWLERLRHKIESKFKNGHDHGQIPFVIPWGLVRLSERHTNSSTKLHRTILHCWRPVQLDQMKKFTIYNVTVSLEGLWILEKSSNRDVSRLNSVRIFRRQFSFKKAQKLKFFELECNVACDNNL